MGKHETLAFKMVVERGRLVPATPYDAERLDTWRNGTPVNVTFVRDGGRIMERKWWAVLNRAVKECSTPWKSSAEASEAIKLAIGVVNLSKTVGGDWMQYPKSLTELDDPELDEAVRMMIDVVHGVTGVDPEEWRKQIAHIRDDAQEAPGRTEGSDRGNVPPEATIASGAPEIEQHEPTEATPRADVAGSGDLASPVDPAADQSTTVEETGADPVERQAPVSIDLSEADLAWLKQTAKMLWAATGYGEQNTLQAQFTGARENFTPPEISAPARERGMSIFKKCKLVCFGEADSAQTLIEIAAIAGVEPKEIV